jgi:hypothetical protein
VTWSARAAGADRGQSPKRAELSSQSGSPKARSGWSRPRCCLRKSLIKLHFQNSQSPKRANAHPHWPLMRLRALSNQYSILRRQRMTARSIWWCSIRTCLRVSRSSLPSCRRKRCRENSRDLFLGLGLSRRGGSAPRCRYLDSLSHRWRPGRRRSAAVLGGRASPLRHSRGCNGKGFCGS